MPELPEVETIKIGLQKKIVGLKISKIQINSPKSFKSVSSQTSFIGNSNLAQGKKVLNIWRRAKILGMDLSSSLRGASATKQSNSKIATGSSNPRNDNGVSLLFHLKMTGQLIWQGGSGKGKGERMIGGHPTPDMIGSMPNSHTRVILSFSDGSHLYFNDQRRFGWVKVIQKSEIKDQKFLNKLGPEPLEKEFKWEILKENLLKHKSQPVKVAIVDQTVVSGIGNIYASEVCFNGKIDPRVRVKYLTDKKFKVLHAGIVKALQDGIKYGGSSRAHFVDAEGHKGYFLDYAYVYGRNNHPCKVCKTEIKKITLGGRGTFFCPKCQR